jgi:pimeloyl-ACP methyl ester carboxylesterase
MQTKELNYKGKTIFYRTTGSGPAVVLIHGFGEEGSVWEGQFNIFPNHQLIVPDLPDSGQSEAIEDMSMEGLADAVKAIIDAEIRPPQTPPREGLSNAQGQLRQEATHRSASSKSEAISDSHPPLWGVGGPGSVVLIGHSMGGYVTLAFAEKYPSYLSGFGLFHSTAYADTEEKKETRRKGIRFIEEHGPLEFLKASTPNLYAPQTREQHPDWIEEHLQTVHNFSGDSLVSYYKAMIQRPDRTAVLKESKMPVLLVIGRHDAAVPAQDSLQQAHLPQIAYIHILEHSGHMGMREELNKANQILSQFVNATQKTA